MNTDPLDLSELLALGVPRPTVAALEKSICFGRAPHWSFADIDDLRAKMQDQRNGISDALILREKGVGKRGLSHLHKALGISR